MGLGCCALWLILGLAGGILPLCLGIVAGLLVAGLLMAFGGRRTPWGRQLCGQVTDFRRHLRNARTAEVQRITGVNPEYFFDRIPYAMAMGVDLAFARQMGSMKLPECTYLTTGMDGHLTAAQWNQLLRETVKLLGASQQQELLKKWLGR